MYRYKYNFSLDCRVQVGAHRVRVSRPALFSHMAFANHLANLVEAYSLDDSSWHDAASSSGGGGGADERREPRFVFLSLIALQPSNPSAKASTSLT